MNLSQCVHAQDCIDKAVAAFTDGGLFYGHGTDNAADEALQLILHALNWDYSISADALLQPLNDAQKQAIASVLQQRIDKKIPAAYITNTAYFCGLRFYVDERVIIPRSPIAELIHDRFSPWLAQDENAALSILDLCTGSGCIAIACAYAFSQAQVDAVDLSADAIAVASDNIQQHQLNHRVRLLQSDLFGALAGRRYDIIVSNPPYVDASDLAQMPQEFHHEPNMALAGGDDGLDLVAIILQQAAEHLTEEGILIVEVGNSADALLARYPQLPFIWLEFDSAADGVFLLRRADLL